MSNVIVPISFPAKTEVSNRYYHSRCWRCLSKTGYYPWALSKKLTCFLAILGVGLISSFICWKWKEHQVQQLNLKLLQENEAQKDRQVEGDHYQAIYSQSVDDSETQDASETADKKRARFLSAQIDNSVAIFKVQFIVVIVGLILYFRLGD